MAHAHFARASLHTLAVVPSTSKLLIVKEWAQLCTDVLIIYGYYATDLETFIQLRHTLTLLVASMSNSQLKVFPLFLFSCSYK